VNCCERRRWALLVGWVLVVVALIGASLAVVSRPVTAEPAEDPTNGCGADVVASANPDTVRICDPSDVQVVAEPACPSCPGGVHVVFVEREQPTDARWQGSAAEGALKQLQQLVPEPGKLKAAVVYYGPKKVRAAVRMTDNMQQVKSALKRGRANSDPPDHNAMGNAAARETLRQLQAARADVAPLLPCEMVIYFAQDSPCPG